MIELEISNKKIEISSQFHYFYGVPMKNEYVFVSLYLCRSVKDLNA